MSLRASKEHCVYCFDVLSHYLLENKRELPKAPFDTSISCPLFITLHKSNLLRGCIGTLSPCPLSKMHDYVYSSAFRDRRFEPLEVEEMPLIDLSVSLLVEYESGDHCLDWEVGKHGIIIELVENNKSYEATYLPEVALEQRWTQEEAVKSLLRKAGYKNKVTSQVFQNIKLTRYQSSKHNITYQEYLAIKDRIHD